MALYHTNVLDPQIKALPTVDTASGSVATFDTDMTENLVEVKCQIVAKQASGTPSPDNHLPITTYTEMNVCHSGINLFDESTYVTGHSYIDISNLKIGATYTILAKNPSGIALFKISESSGSTPIWQSLSLSGATFTVTQAMLDIGKLWIINSFYQTATVEEVQTAKISLNYPSTDTEYHAYNGTTANIPFGQTVANGVLDVTTGKLRVTHAYADLSTLSWSSMSGDRWETSDLVSDILKPASNADIVPLVCSILAAKSVNDLYLHSDVIGIAVPTNGRLQCRTGDTVNTPTGDLVYPLETPQEIQLDSITLQALLNENNIWCDTGDTEVKYLLTVGKKIA